MKNLEDFNHDVEVTKNLLSSMPKNNEKNLKLYKDKVKETKKEYQKQVKTIFEEIKNRSGKYFAIKPSGRLDVVKSELEGYKELRLFSPINSPFEKLGLDTLLYSLNHYYKTDLEEINKNIKKIFSKFELAGVPLTDKDFIYSPMAQKYIAELLKDDEIERMKDILEDIHWKCPDVILHIETCLRILYNKNIKKFEQYIETRKKEILSDALSFEDFESKRNNLAKEEYDLENFDNAIVLKKFMSGELLLNDYSKPNVDKCYVKFLGENVRMSENKNMIDDFKNLLFNLNEYKNYLRYSFVIDDIKKKYADIDKHVGECTTINKEIDGLIAELTTLSNEMKTGKTKGFLFFKKAVDQEQLELQINEKIRTIDEKFESYDDALIYEKLKANINDTSSLYNVLEFAYSYKGYLRKCIKTTDDNVDILFVKNMVRDFEKFLLDPNINILHKIPFGATNNLAEVIVDHYKLLNINLNIEELTLEDIDNLIKSLNIIVYDACLDNIGISIDFINELFDSKKLIEKYEGIIE